MKAVLALANRRNEELHTGAAAFEAYQPNQWLVGFFRSCKSLSTSMNESLVTLFGQEEGNAAADMLTDNQNDVRQRVQSLIAAHKKVFEAKTPELRAAVKKESEELGEKLSVKRHHRVVCPACECIATVQGTPVGKEQIRLDEDEIIVRQSIAPNFLTCSACGLKLQNYSELDAAKIGGHYTRTKSHTPEDYYGLIDPENLPTDLIEQLYENRFGPEYDNE